MERMRKVSAWLLSSVFILMMAVSALHTHPDILTQETKVECERCAQDIHHGGHITAKLLYLHDCVLCHFLGLPYLFASILALTVSVATVRTLSYPDAANSRPGAWDTSSARAPPSIL